MRSSRKNEREAVGVPYGADVLRLPAKERERIRRAILVSTNESDAEIAARLGGDPYMVAQMRERLEGLGVIAKGSGGGIRRPRPKKSTDNLDLFEEQTATGQRA